MYEGALIKNSTSLLVTLDYSAVPCNPQKTPLQTLATRLFRDDGFLLFKGPAGAMVPFWDEKPQAASLVSTALPQDKWPLPKDPVRTPSDPYVVEVAAPMTESLHSVKIVMGSLGPFLSIDKVITSSNVATLYQLKYQKRDSALLAHGFSYRGISAHCLEPDHVSREKILKPHTDEKRPNDVIAIFQCGGTLGAEAFVTQLMELQEKLDAPPPTPRDKISQWNTEDNTPRTPTLANTSRASPPSPPLFPPSGATAPDSSESTSSTPYPTTSGPSPPSNDHPSPSPEMHPQTEGDTDVQQLLSPILEAHTHNPYSPNMNKEVGNKAISDSQKDYNFAEAINVAQDPSPEEKTEKTDTIMVDHDPAPEVNPVSEAINVDQDPPPEEKTEKIDTIEVNHDPPPEENPEAPYKISPAHFASSKVPDGLDYFPEFFTAEEEDSLITMFDRLQPNWDTSMHRHLKHFGYGMGANGTDIARLEDLPPEFEPYIEKILLQLSPRSISIDAPNQVTVARYQPRSGRGDHVDAEALGKYVLDLNLECPVPVHLRHVKGGHHYVHWMDSGSLTCSRGEARWSYLHAIPKTTMDERNGQYTQRVLRYAMILRHCECHG